MGFWNWLTHHPNGNKDSIAGVSAGADTQSTSKITKTVTLVNPGMHCLCVSLVFVIWEGNGNYKDCGVGQLLVNAFKLLKEKNDRLTSAINSGYSVKPRSPLGQHSRKLLSAACVRLTGLKINPIML